MIDIGVASPSAHGQAMISTATAFDEARGPARGSGPSDAPYDERQRRGQHHRRHEVARHRVGQALNRRAAALRLGHHPHDLRQQRVGADALGAHHEAAGAVDRRRR